MTEAIPSSPAAPAASAAFDPDAPVLRAVRARRSRARVGTNAPADADIAALLRAAARVADHAALHPWRIITLRGRDRERLGAAMAAADGLEGSDAERRAAKPLRAPLLLAIVSSPVEHPKATQWEQEATAAGVAHLLSLLLDEQGWGVMWRTGSWIDSPGVRELHGLAPQERLLGWLYIGDPDGAAPAPRGEFDATGRLSPLPERP